MKIEKFTKLEAKLERMLVAGGPEKNVGSEGLLNAFNAEKDFTKVEGLVAENHKSLTAL